jgi:hypothetical protein
MVGPRDPPPTRRLVRTVLWTWAGLNVGFLIGAWWATRPFREDEDG